MHLSPESLAPAVVAVSAIGAGAAIARVASKVAADVTPARVGIAAALSGAILVAHVAEFPVPGGTAHVLGAAVAAMLLGPRLAALLLAALIAAQAAMFGDGSLAALGLNVINMALVAVAAGWFVYRAFEARFGSLAAAAAAGWASLAAAQIAVSVEAALGIAEAPADVVATIGGHVVNASLEVAVTVGVAACVAAVARRVVVPAPEKVST